LHFIKRLGAECGNYAQATIKKQTMRILILTTFFPPLNSIASLRPYSWAKYWTIEGHDVTVYTTEKIQDSSVMLYLPNPGFKLIETRQPKLFKTMKSHYNVKTDSLAKNGVREALRNVLHRLRDSKGIFNACRMPDLTDFWAWQACKTLGRNRKEWDLVVSTAGPYTAHLIAHHLKKKHLAKFWIADYRDPWSNNHIYKGVIPFRLAETLLERKIIKRADAVTAVSEPFAQAIQAHLRLPKVHVIENGFDQDDLANLPKQPIFLDDGKFRIVYTGTIYKDKQDPSVLFETIYELSHDPEYFSLLDQLEVLFAGRESEYLNHLITKFAVQKWVRSVGFVSREDALRMQRDAHALLFLPWTDSANKGVLTGKIYEYMHSKTPIIALGGSSLEAAQCLITETRTGEVLLKQDEIRNYLMTHLRNREKKYVQPSSELLNCYSRKQLSQKLLEITKKFK